MTASSQPRPGDPGFPEAGGRRVVFLLDAASRLEERLLRGWIERLRAGGRRGRGARDPELAAPARRRIDARLEPVLAAGDDPLLAPLRVVWRPRERRRRARGAALGSAEARRPARSESAARALRAAHGAGARAHRRGRAGARPRRCASAGARAPARTPARRSASPSSWCARPIWCSTSRSGACAARATRCRASCTRTCSGARPSAASSRCWRARSAARRVRAARGRARPARDRRQPQSLRDRPRGAALAARSTSAATARRCTTSPRRSTSCARSRSDTRWCSCPRTSRTSTTPCCSALLHENGLPPNHTAGGINMNFFPLGPLVRRAGVFFIRRSFKDDEVYKLVLRHYVDYADREALPARVVHRGRALALGQAAAAALRHARLRGGRLPARAQRRRAAGARRDLLRPDLRRVRLRGRAAGRREGARELLLVPAPRAPARPPLRPHRGALRRAALAACGAGRARPERGARPRRAQPRAPEARLRACACASTARRRSRRSRWCAWRCSAAATVRSRWTRCWTRCTTWSST